jgi:hypothetical protein
MATASPSSFWGGAHSYHGPLVLRNCVFVPSAEKIPWLSSNPSAFLTVKVLLLHSHSTLRDPATCAGIKHIPCHYPQAIYRNTFEQALVFRMWKTAHEHQKVFILIAFVQAICFVVQMYRSLVVVEHTNLCE